MKVYFSLLINSARNILINDYGRENWKEVKIQSFEFNEYKIIILVEPTFYYKQMKIEIQDKIYYYSWAEENTVNETTKTVVFKLNVMKTYIAQLEGKELNILCNRYLPIGTDEKTMCREQWEIINKYPSNIGEYINLCKTNIIDYDYAYIRDDLTILTSPTGTGWFGKNGYICYLHDFNSCIGGRNFYKPDETYKITTGIKWTNNIYDKFDDSNNPNYNKYIDKKVLTIQNINNNGSTILDEILNDGSIDKKVYIKMLPSAKILSINKTTHSEVGLSENRYHNQTSHINPIYYEWSWKMANDPFLYFNSTSYIDNNGNTHNIGVENKEGTTITTLARKGSLYNSSTGVYNFNNNDVNIWLNEGVYFCVRVLTYTRKLNENLNYLKLSMEQPIFKSSYNTENMATCLTWYGDSPSYIYQDLYIDFKGDIKYYWKEQITNDSEYNTNYLLDYNIGENINCIPYTSSDYENYSRENYGWQQGIKNNINSAQNNLTIGSIQGAFKIAGSVVGNIATAGSLSGVSASVNNALSAQNDIFGVMDLANNINNGISKISELKNKINELNGKGSTPKYSQYNDYLKDYSPIVRYIYDRRLFNYYYNTAGLSINEVKKIKINFNYTIQSFTGKIDFHELLMNIKWSNKRHISWLREILSEGFTIARIDKVSDLYDLDLFLY